MNISIRKIIFFIICALIFTITTIINFYMNTHTIFMYNSFLIPTSYYVLSTLLIIPIAIILLKLIKIKIRKRYIIIFIILLLTLQMIATNFIVSKDEVVYKNLKKPLSDKEYHENNPNSIIKIKNLLKENNIELTDIRFLNGKKNNVNVVLLINEKLVVLTNEDRTIILDKFDMLNYIDKIKEEILRDKNVESIDYINIYGYKIKHKNGNKKQYRFNIYFEDNKIKVTTMEA